jgi:hypothetical protein
VWYGPKVQFSTFELDIAKERGATLKVASLAGKTYLPIAEAVSQTAINQFRFKLFAYYYRVSDGYFR